MSAESLDRLERLDRSLLTVFLAGPGFGEGLAIALPGGGWILVDGCRTAATTGQDLPALAILRRWAKLDDRVEWLILTHPHTDHAEGFVEVLDAAEPVRVGLAGLEPPGPTAVTLLRAWQLERGLTEQQIRRRQVEAALRAIADWEHRHDRLATALYDGVTLDLPPEASVTARVCAPSRAALAEWTAEPWPRARRHANDLSTVLELTFGATRLLLGGDLPWRRSGTRQDIASGWAAVLSSHPDLGRNLHAFKVPHHGSRDALHPDLLGQVAGTESWWGATPYSRSRLPRPGEGQGVQRLLEHARRVGLTALPTSRGRQLPVPHPAELTHDDYAQLVAETSRGFLEGAEDIRPAPVVDALAPVWAVVFDRHGRQVSRWRGPVAFDLVREAPGPERSTPS